MELPTAKLTLKTILGQEFIVEYYTIISEYESEQIEKVYFEKMEEGADGKTIVKDKANLVSDRENKVLNVLIKNIEGIEVKDDFAMTVKKSLPRLEYNKLMDILNPIAEPVDEVKKKTSQKS